MTKRTVVGLFSLLVVIAVAAFALSQEDETAAPLPIAEAVEGGILFGPPTPTPPISSCGYNVSTCARKDRYHTGIDYQRPASGTTAVVATNRGFVVHREPMNPFDQGMGSNVILEHVLESGKRVYSSYSHLASIDGAVKMGSTVEKGQTIGIMGGSGYGEPNYWGVHLHFEIKDRAVPYSPSGGPYWGYTPVNPDQFGYHDPDSFIGIVTVEIPEIPPPSLSVTVLSPSGGALRRGARILVKWSTSGADPQDAISIDFKRDSAANLIAPDGVNFVRLARNEANDGSQRVSIPIAIALAKDWRIYVQHDASGTSDASDAPVRVRR